MRFQVPQYIEVEDKIFGPLTFKQFIYVGGGAGAVVLLFQFLPNFLAFILSIPVGIFAAALAFYKVNEKPFIHMVEAFFKFHTGHKLYIWKKEDKQPTTNDVRQEPKPIEQVYVPKLSDSKLKELTWSLDIKESENPVTPTTNDERRTTNDI